MNTPSDRPLATVGRYDAAYEAHLAKAQLDDAEIPSRVINEDMTGLTMFFSREAGSVKVKVPAAYADEARAVLGTDETGSG